MQRRFGSSASLAAVGTCVEQPTERQGAIQSASTTHTRQHPHHARRDRYRSEARSTADSGAEKRPIVPRKMRRRCHAGRDRANPTHNGRWVERWPLRHFCSRDKEAISNTSALPRGKQHTLDFVLIYQVTDPKFHNETRSMPTGSILCHRCKVRSKPAFPYRRRIVPSGWMGENSR